MSPDQPSSAATSCLLGRERRTLRYTVSSSLEGGGSAGSAEFLGLDRARLHAWALALEGHSARISKLVYDTTPSPPLPLGSAVVEDWDERSAFILLNASLIQG